MPQINVSCNNSPMPKQFIVAMKTLFDIMDDGKTGYVKLSDIENRWRDDGTKGLPKGVISSLKNITPHDGLLSFDQFCSGLKICLLKNQDDHVHIRTSKSGQFANENLNIAKISQPLCSSIKIVETEPQGDSKWLKRKAILPSTVDFHLPALNYPQMTKDRNGNQLDNPEYFFNTEKFSQNQQNVCAPPKPPRSLTNGDKNLTQSGNLGLQEKAKWQIGQSVSDVKTAMPKRLYSNEEFVFIPSNRGAGDGKPDTVFDASPNLNSIETATSTAEVLTHLHQKKTNVRRREPRRHTLQNGIDYSMLKRMKKIEQEKDILIQGLAAVDKARDWYLQQLEKVQEKIRFLGRMGSHMEQWTEAHQERLELQKTRVYDVNRQLEALAESWQKGGLLLHMNLALSPQQQNSTSSTVSNTIAKLQQKNHLLSEDVSKKCERISMLEREKSSLIRELLQFRSHGSKTGNF